MNEEAIQAVMDFYQIDKEDAIQYYKDEIKAYQRLVSQSLDADIADFVNREFWNLI